MHRSTGVASTQSVIYILLTWFIGGGLQVGTQSRAEVGPLPEFDVASVRVGSDRPEFPRAYPGGRVTASLSLGSLIESAYQVKRFQVIGPEWRNRERFTITAKASGEIPPTKPGQIGRLELLLQSLLADRFQLQAHWETRDLPAYVLIPTSENQKKFGRGLRQTNLDCSNLDSTSAKSLPREACAQSWTPGKVHVGGIQMSELVDMFGFIAIPELEGRHVVDQTKLKGYFDVDLTWAPIITAARSGSGSTTVPPSEPQGPSFFTAIEEQWGLKLQPRRVPTPVIVIDRLARPTPN